MRNEATDFTAICRVNFNVADNIRIRLAVLIAAILETSFSSRISTPEISRNPLAKIIDNRARGG